VRSGSDLKREDLQSMLSYALEELRMTIDSMEQMEGDLPTMLGTLRRRIGPALEAAGIELVWDVHDVPAVFDVNDKPLEARSVMHLFRCLQEIFANVIKHAKASRVTVTTVLTEQGVVLSVMDNGRGMDRVEREGGHGLDNVRARAAAIGAVADWTKLDTGGTRVRLIFTRYEQTLIQPHDNKHQ
jgi:signal transduction histidine kinase